jgi:hypothetical protein
MKKECQYCHHQRHHHPVGRTYCMQIEHVIRSISPLWTNQLRFFCQLVFLFLLTWSYFLFLSNFSLLSNLIFFAGCSTPHSSQLRLIPYSYWGREVESPEVCRLLYAGNVSPHFLNRILCWRSLSYPDYRVIWSIRIPPFRIKLL